MKTNLLQLVLLMFLTFNSIEAKQTFEINSKQIKEMMKTNILYIIGVNDKNKWHKKKIKVKNFQSIGKGFFEYRFVKLNFSNYKKDKLFIVYGKEDSTSIEFVKKLRTFGFKNVKYLKDGNKSWNKILINFRGIKLFSIFTK